MADENEVVAPAADAPAPEPGVQEPVLDPTPAKDEGPVLPSGGMVLYQQSKKVVVPSLVLNVAADGALTLLMHDENGVRSELSGVQYDAGGAIGTWHE